MLNQIDLSRVDLNLLVLFEVVLEERHVGRAAGRLHLSPSAISHGLRRLRRLLKDPLFLRTPKGVVPTERALALAAPVADILSRARLVISMAEPFDPATSNRRFTIGAPDGVSAVFLPPLVAAVRDIAPGIDLSLRQILPPRGGSTEGTWDHVFTDLDQRAMDIAVVPVEEVPARFVARMLHEEEFVIAMRSGHPFGREPSLDVFCRMDHLLVSLTGDPLGFIDELLSREGLSRRVVLTVPNFLFALSVVGETDLLAALPRQFVERHAERFGVASAPVPLPLERSRIQAVASKAALADAGVAWLFDRLARAVAG
jgi:Transcriptional regulator